MGVVIGMRVRRFCKTQPPSRSTINDSTQQPTNSNQPTIDNNHNNQPSSPNQPTIKSNQKVGDVIYIEANSGAAKRVGRCDAYATEFDLEAEEYVPLPKVSE